MVNTNKLVKFYDGVDGFKTGYTKEAGYCLTATAKKNGMRVITVVMGEEDNKVRNTETTQMLDYAFANYKLDTIVSKNTILQKKEIDRGKKKYVSLVPMKDITTLHKISEKSKKIDYTLDINSIKAPVKKGDIVGKITVTENGKKERQMNITVKESVEKANILDLYLRFLSEIISGDISI